MEDVIKTAGTVILLLGMGLLAATPAVALSLYLAVHSLSSPRRASYRVPVWTDKRTRLLLALRSLEEDMRRYCASRGES